MDSKLAGKYCIVGLGVTEVGHVPGRSISLLEVEAARLALEDAGLQPSDIDVAIQAQSDPGGGVRTRRDDSFARMLGMPIKTYIENIGRGGEYAATAIMLAMQFLELGIARHVVISGAKTDWSDSRSARARGERGNQRMDRQGVNGKPYGLLRAPGFHSMIATRHMHEFGTTSEDFGRIAVAQREWANRNPRAYMYGRPMTLEDHQESPWVVWPLHMLDCCLQSDGGTAWIVTTAERARDLKKPPVYIQGIGFGEQAGDLWWEKKHYTSFAVQTSRNDAFGMAGITLKDLDFAQLYDCFTPEVMVQLEDYGWCGKGEGAAFVREGHLGPGGDLPVNTGGGLLSSHHLGNMTGFAEAVRQLRHECDGNQVPNARLGIATGHGGEIVSGGMCATHTTLVLGNEA